MRQLVDNTLGETEKNVFHNASAVQSGKQAVTLKHLDSGGLWWLVQWTSGSWSGQTGWVPWNLLTSS